MSDVSGEPADPLPPDARTAAAFAESWNRVGSGSVYDREQFLDWLEPLRPVDLEGRSILEMGFGNGSLLVHVLACKPGRLAGVELGDTLEQTRRNLAGASPPVELHRGDLLTCELGLFDVVYCIGVLHHLASPEAGFRAVLRHVAPGGRFHCWVYAHEGNALVRGFVEPLRRMACRLPWWVTKYALALPLAVPFFVAARLLAASLVAGGPVSRLAARVPLAGYARWIAPRPFSFFRHVAFDQLVTPRTVYLREATLRSWLAFPEVDPESAYLVFRNGNSWKLGGRRRAAPPSE